MTLLQKSPLDSCEYQSITLDNNLRVLLIHDPNVTESTVVLGIRVGGIEDTIPGINHILEHVLLLFANDLYEEYSFVDFIGKHSGTYNASTTHDQVVYHYKINTTFLSESLERFAELFTTPHFDHTIIQREIQIIDHEFRRNYDNDTTRAYSIFKKPLNQNNPYSKFIAGNKDTLNIDHIELSTTLLPHCTQFVELCVHETYSNYYGAQNMQLTIHSNTPLVNQQLDELSTTKEKSCYQRLVKAFSRIKQVKYNNRKSVPYIVNPSKVLFESRLNGNTWCVWYITGLPVTDDLIIDAKGFLTNLLTDPECSLRQHLIKNKMAYDLTVAFDDVFDGYEMKIGIAAPIQSNLTGIILDCIQTIANKIKNNDNRIAQLYNQHIQLIKQKYNYDYQLSCSTILDNASTLLKYDVPFECVYFQPDALIMYNNKVKSFLLQFLSQINTNLIVYCATNQKLVNAQTDKIYKTKYTIDRLEINHHSHHWILPSLNSHVCGDIECTLKDTQPIQLSSNPNVWLIQTTQSCLSTVEITMRYPNAFHNYAAFLLFAHYFNIRISTIIEQMRLAGHHIKIHVLLDMIHIRIKSCPEKIKSIIKYIINQYTNIEYNHHSFEKAQSKTKSSLHTNNSFSQTLNTALSHILSIPNQSSLLKSMSKVSYSDFPSTSSSCHIRVLVTDNVDESLCQFIINHMSHFNHQYVLPIKHQLLQPGQCVIINNQQSHINIQFQLGQYQQTKDEFAQSIFMAHLFKTLIDPQYFKTIRTEQLGYIAFIDVVEYSDGNDKITIYIQFVIQSTHNVKQLSKRTHEFIDSLNISITPKEFNDHVNVFMNYLFYKYGDYAELVKYGITRIESYESQFRSALLKLTTNDFIEFINKHITNKTTRSIWEFT